ncbi:MAG TPA: hypothetical protein DEQ38_06400 [Elusimicrobia bacterium]|nr:MAG: hypothetical protein A2089_08865 [Elusimicrobia bacterium GWD2_63_28]HCC47732.1 hypothetical protein [Elusimicrobiota bacterium]
MHKRYTLAAALLALLAGSAAAQFVRTEDLRVRPPEAWKPHTLYGLDLTLGGSYLNGNVKNYGFNGGLEFDWKPATDHSVFLQAADNYVKYGETAVTDKSKGSLLYAYAVKPRLNLFLQTTHNHDKFRSVKYRMTNTAGLCYHNFLPGVLKPVMLSAGLTPEYEKDNAGGIKRDLRATGRLNFAMQLTDTMKLNGDLIYTPRLADTGDARLYAESYLEFKVWKEAVAFRLTATEEYDSRPSPGIKRNDFGLNHALVVKFAR